MTKDELFPPPVSATLFLWVMGWEETGPGEDCWECEGATEGAANYGFFDTDDALALAHEYLDLLLAHASLGLGRDAERVEAMSEQYTAYLLLHDADFRMERQMEWRIAQAVTDGLLQPPNKQPVPNGQRPAPTPLNAPARQLALAWETGS